MTGVAEVTATSVGAGLVLGEALAVGVVVVAGDERIGSSCRFYHFANAAEMIAAVEVVLPRATVLALLTLRQVAAVDGGGVRSGASPLVSETDAVE